MWAATTLTFFLIRQMPGDIVYQWALQLQTMQGIDFQQAEAQARVMLNYQPGQSILSQYASYMMGLLHGNLGTSLVFQVPVWKVISQALPWTLILAVGSVSLSFVVGTCLGLLAAWKRHTRLPDFLRVYATVSQAVPDFLVGLLLICIFGIKLQWFPLPGGAYSTYVTPGFHLSFLLDVAYHAILPIVAFATPMVADWAMAAFASASSVREELFLSSAEAQGLPVRRIVLGYLGPNALLPLIPGLAGSFAGVLGGVVLVEAIFGYPGLGLFLARSIELRDFPLMQGLFLLTTAATIVANVAGELVIRRLDPRIAKEAG